MLCPTRKMRNSAVRTSDRLLLRSFRLMDVDWGLDSVRSVAVGSFNVVASNAFERIARLIGTFPRRASVATAAVEVARGLNKTTVLHSAEGPPAEHGRVHSRGRRKRMTGRAYEISGPLRTTTSSDEPAGRDVRTSSGNTSLRPRMNTHNGRGPAHVTTSTDASTLLERLEC